MIVLLVATLLTEVTARLLKHNALNDAWVYVIFQPVEFGLLTYIYYLELRQNGMLLTIPIYGCLVVAYRIYALGPNEFGTASLLVTMFVTSLWALLYLKALLQYPKEANLLDFALFWATCGLLLFNASSIFIYGTHNFASTLATNFGGLFRIIRVTTNHLLYFTILLSLAGGQKTLREV